MKKAKENGKILGRPKGKKSTNAKLATNHNQTESLLKDKVSVSAIGSMMKVDRKTMGRYIERNLFEYAKNNSTFPILPFVGISKNAHKGNRDFISYANRAADIMKEDEINHQVRNHKKQLNKYINEKK